MGILGPFALVLEEAALVGADLDFPGREDEDDLLVGHVERQDAVFLRGEEAGEERAGDEAQARKEEVADREPERRLRGDRHSVVFPPESLQHNYLQDSATQA